MNIIETKFAGVFIIEPKVFSDDRGYFFEMHNQKKYEAICPQKIFVQDNISHSMCGVLRGLHYQLHHAQGKLVSVLRGSVLDVIVDIRPDSTTFKEWLAIEISEQNHRQIYIPPGYAHGFYVLSDEAYFHYKCTDYYHPEDEFGLIWNDPDINIAWPLITKPILSPKDEKYPTIRQIHHEHLPRVVK